MFFKLIFPMLMDLFKSNPFQSSQSNESLESLKKVLRKELGAQLLKVFAGLILTAIIIISLAKLATALNIYIEQFQNSLVLQIATFGIVALLCAGGLVFMFIGDTFKKKVAEPPPPQFDIQSLFLKFAEGVVQGFEKNRPLKEDAPS